MEIVNSCNVKEGPHSWLHKHLWIKVYPSIYPYVMRGEILVDTKEGGRVARENDYIIEDKNGDLHVLTGEEFKKEIVDVK